jgi:hypothetical protein
VRSKKLKIISMKQIRIIPWRILAERKFLELSDQPNLNPNLNSNGKLLVNPSKGEIRYSGLL